MPTLPERCGVNKYGASFALVWQTTVTTAASWLCTQTDAFIVGEDGFGWTWS